MSESQIKSSTIMFTDVFGYSRMVGKDEKHALQLLDQHNTIITKSIQEYSGSVVKFIGDAVFAEFAKSIDASRCAIDIQQKFNQRNRIQEKNDRIHIRIGLHMGTLVVKGDDLFGNTVNLGSRIESVAPVDGILISSPVYDTIKEDADFFTKELGFVKLKNIKDPCLLYKLYLDKLSYTAQSDAELEKETLNRGVQIVNMEKFSPLDVYSIGIMYFKNLGDKEDEVVCRSIAQDIIKELTKINGIRTPSATEIDQYQDTDLPMSEVARRMQTEYMLFGSILKEGEDYRLSLEMKDMTNGNTLFEQDYVFKTIEINATKGRMLHTILSHFDIALPLHIKQYLQVEPTSSTEALDCFLKAYYLLDIPKSKDDLLDAQSLLQKSTELDPAFLGACAMKGWVSFVLSDYDTAEVQYSEALELASQDNLETSDAYVYTLFGSLYDRLGKYKKAMDFHQKALDVYIKYDSKRSLGRVLNNLGTTYTELYETDKALDCFNRSLAINEELEDYNLLAAGYAQLSNLYFSLGDYSVAIDNSHRALGYFRSVDNRYNMAITMLILAESYSKVCIFDHTEDLLESAREINEEFGNNFGLGKIDALYGEKMFSENHIDKAISYYEESIEKFQLEESREWVLTYSIEIAHILIYAENFTKAGKYINKAKQLFNKTHDAVKKDGVLIDVMGLYIACMEKEDTQEQLDGFFQNMQNSSEVHYLSWYYLAKAFSEWNKNTESEESIQKAKIILKREESKISDVTHRESFITNHLIRKEITA